nr:sulfotransferase [Phaeobacter sp. J2-8]
MKAGTSWLYDYLSTHPSMHFSRQKEVHYFDVMASGSERHHLNSKINMLSERVAEIQNTPAQDISAGIRKVEAALEAIQIYKNESGTHEEYRKYLTKGHVSQKIIGDITPSYCALPEERLAEMYALAPSVKFVFVMRDPIDRLWSAVRMRAHELDGDFEATCRALANEVIQNKTHPMLTRSGYKDTIEKLRRVAPEEDLLFLFYETMFTQDVRNQICDFLGVPHHTGSDTKRVNAGRPADMPEDIRAGYYALLEPEYSVVRKAFPTSVPDTWYDPRT